MMSRDSGVFNESVKGRCAIEPVLRLDFKSLLLYVLTLKPPLHTTSITV